METNQTITITDLAYGGEGVGHIEGKAVFVRGCLPGEVADIEITEEKKRFARGRLVATKEPSSQRCESVCPVAAVCPGCAYQQLTYAQELTWKKQQLIGLFARIGSIKELPAFEPNGCPKPLCYRNKVVLHADGEGHLGYRGHDNRTIVDVDDCPLAVEPIRAAIQAFRTHELHRLAAGDRVTFRWTAADGVLFWVNSEAPPRNLVETSDQKSWHVPASGFWQVNTVALDLLLQTVRDMTSGISAQYLIDLYCGSGLFALSLASDDMDILGVELSGAAIRAARLNARTHGVASATFIAGDATRLYRQAQEEVDPAKTLLVLDPPRSGLHQTLLQALGGPGGPSHILYISCAADTLARDCKALDPFYEIRDLQLVDMFPRTAHFETILLFARRS